MLEKVLVIASGENEIAELTTAADALGTTTLLLTMNKDARGADTIYCFEQAGSIAHCLSAMAQLAQAEQPQLILAESTKDGRLAAGYLAAALGTSPLPEAASLSVTDNAVETTRLVYGGSAVKTERASFPAVVVLGAGVFEAKTISRGDTVIPMEGKTGGLTLKEVKENAAQSVNLASAKRVVGVGRGLGTVENVPLAEKLASLLGAEIGCTRPVSEEEHWYTKDRYIGVSGCMIKPALYLAIGISGQIQHMVGVNQSNVVFAVNKDENAPIFKQADYGIVGDVSTLLPEIIRRLEK